MEFRILFALNWKIRVSLFLGESPFPSSVSVSSSFFSSFSFPNCVYCLLLAFTVTCTVHLNWIFTCKLAVNNSTMFNSHFTRVVSQRGIEWAMFWNRFLKISIESRTKFEWIIDIAKPCAFEKAVTIDTIIESACNAFERLATSYSLDNHFAHWKLIGCQLSICVVNYFRFISEMFRMVFFFSFSLLFHHLNESALANQSENMLAYKNSERYLLPKEGKRNE